MQQQKKKKSRCTTKWVNFRNIMLGVDGKSQKTTFNLILFCEVNKQAKLNMNTVLVKHLHTSYKEFFLFEKILLLCLEDKDLQDHVGNCIPVLIYFDWSVTGSVLSRMMFGRCHAQVLLVLR